MNNWTYADEVTLQRKTCNTCGEKFRLVYTDLHGEVVCRNCNTSYQTRVYMIESHYVGCQPEDVKTPCLTHSSFLKRHIFNAYWNETGKRVPSGTYLSPSSRWYTQEDEVKFFQWLLDNREQFPECEQIYYMSQVERFVSNES